jgi:hypothetical protein
MQLHTQRAITKGLAILTRVGVQADLGRCLMSQVLRAVEGLRLGYNDV